MKITESRHRRTRGAGLASWSLADAFRKSIQGEGAVTPHSPWSGDLQDWFRVPDWLLYHMGHAWARVDGVHLLAVGVDDFAQQLVGPLDGVDLPAAGTTITRGQPGWTLLVEGQRFDVLSPVDGTVIAANPSVRRKASLVNTDPYGRGWILKVKVSRVSDATKDLLRGQAATEWMHALSDELTAAMASKLGPLAQDGGLPLHGIARGLDPAHWDQVARRFLLTA